jgi:hypothetical protein
MERSSSGEEMREDGKNLLPSSLSNLTYLFISDYERMKRERPFLSVLVYMGLESPR